MESPCYAPLFAVQSNEVASNTSTLSIATRRQSVVCFDDPNTQVHPLIEFIKIEPDKSLTDILEDDTPESAVELAVPAHQSIEVDLDVIMTWSSKTFPQPKFATTESDLIKQENDVVSKNKPFFETVYIFYNLGIDTQLGISRVMILIENN